MKYVIKGRWTGNDEYYVSNTTPAFSYTSDLNKAWLFWHIDYAIDAIVARQIDIDVNKVYRSNDKFTIIGIEEVSTPRYREVAL